MPVDGTDQGAFWARAKEIAAALVEERGVELFRYARTTPSPRWSRSEVTVGQNAMAFGVEEVRALVAHLAATAAP